MRTAKTVSLRLLTGILIILPPAAVLRIILKYGQNIPFMDQWGTPGRIIVLNLWGKLTLADFFLTHNESIKAFTSLIWFLLARGGWNPRVEMVVAWLVTLALAVVLYFLLRKTLDGSSFIRHAIFVLMVLFLFHPHGTENWLTGLGMETALVILFLSAGLLVNSSSVPAWSMYLLTACFSLAATFSYANGMLLWVLICPALPFLGTSRPRPKTRIPGLLYLAAGLACIFLYFSIVAASPSKAAQANLELGAPLKTITFLLHWLGAPFQFPGIPWTGPVMAVVFLLLFSVPVCSLIQRVWQKKDSAAFRPWLLLAIYALITGTTVALGRQSFGLKTALVSRYFMHVVLLPIAILPLAALVLRNMAASIGHRRLRHVLYISLTGLMVFSCTISIISQWTEADVLARNTAHKRTRGAVALSFIDLIPRNPDLSFLNPSTTILKSRARIFIRHGMLDLPLHKPPPFGKNRPGEVLIDGLKLELSEDGSILATGSCPNTHAGGEISHILLTSFHGARREKAFAVFRPKDSRYQEQVERNTTTESHFRRHLSTVALEPGRHRLKAWVYDSTSREYTPLANEWMINIDSEGLFFLNGASSELGEGQGKIP